MKVVKLKSFKPGENAFLQDIENMGVQMGISPNGAGESRVMIMYRNFESQVCKWLVVVDEATGERIRIDFEEEEDVN
jgi:hypothetical protein